MQKEKPLFTADQLEPKELPPSGYQNKAEGGMIHDEEHESMLDAIMAKRKGIDLAESSEEGPATHDDFNLDAADKGLYEEGDLPDQPEESNEHGVDLMDHEHDRDMISAIMHKLKTKKDL